MIRIVSAIYLHNYRIALTFSDGLAGTFDLASYLRSHQGPLLNALMDEGYAQQCFVDAGALGWPNGLQLSPRRLHGLCQLPGAA